MNDSAFKSQEQRQIFRAACRSSDFDTVTTMLQTGQISSTTAMFTLTGYLYEAGIPVLRTLLSNGASTSDFTLSWLDDCKDVAVFQLLAEFGVDFKTGGHDILENHIANRPVLDFLIDQGVDINSSKSHRARPHLLQTEFDHTVGVLNRAAALGDVKLFDYLVSRGADPKRSIALHHATDRFDEEVELSDDDDEGPPKFWAKPDELTRGMIEHLITTYDFDVNGTDEPPGLREMEHRMRRTTPSGTPLDWALDNKNATAVETLVTRGANVSGRQVNKAILRSNVGAVKVFLEVKDLNATDMLEKAIGPPKYSVGGTTKPENMLEIARMCLEKGADPETAMRVCQVNVEAGKSGAKPIHEDMRALLEEWKIKMSRGPDKKEIERLVEERKSVLRSGEYFRREASD